MVHRKIEPVILEMLDIFRIVAINGPRQSGKTTLQKKIAKLRNMKYYTFDDPDVSNTASNDPIGFIGYISKENVAIDEVQMIHWNIKKSLNLIGMKICSHHSVATCCT